MNFSVHYILAILSSEISISTTTCIDFDKGASMKRGREESEWTEGFSSKYKRKYWFNNVTGKSVWEDPHTSQTAEV